MKLSEETTWSLFERMQGEIAREIRVLLGESAYDQRMFTAEQRERRIESLKRVSTGTDGWIYGSQFNTDLKEHPNLLPYAELPESTKSKVKIFDVVAQYARAFAECDADFAGTDAPSEGL